MEIVKFSSEKAEEYYNHYSDNPLKKFADDRKKMEKSKNTTQVLLKNQKTLRKKLGLYKDKNKEEDMTDKVKII